MPRQAGEKIPAYRLHKASGRGVATIAGREVYFGPYKSPASRAAYDRAISEWLAAGRPRAFQSPAEITISEVLVLYHRWAKVYYQKNGKPTATLSNIAPAARALRLTYGTTPANEFGPLALKALRQQWVDAGHSREYVNRLTEIVKRIFKWGASEELIEPRVYQALATVAGLKKGRTPAPDPGPVQLVADEVIEATLPHLPPIVADMVRFQRLTACRPQEVCALRPCDVEADGEVWIYRPAGHKTEHHGKDRFVFIGPAAQAILRPYLERPAESHCFVPAESERQRLKDAHKRRKTPLSCGNRPGTNKKRNRKRAPGNCYTTNTYRRAIERATEKATEHARQQAKARGEDPAKAGIEKWTPNRLRHTAATEIRRKYGLEAAQVILGHSKADVTQVYAERNVELAKKVVSDVG